MKKFTCAVSLTVLFVFGAASALAATQAGLVLTVQAGAWAERDGQKTVLNVKSEILPGDVLVTDSSGRVQVIFADDTTISLGADTRVAVAEFLFDAPGQKPSFSADMAQGAARFVTGKVVEQNRAGFKVTTPQATVGIRGTTFAVNVSPQGVTSVVGLKVDGAFPIAVTNLKTGAVSTINTSGLAVDASASGNSSYQAPPGQFSQTGSAVNGSPKLAASAPAAGSSEAVSVTAAAAAAPATPASPSMSVAAIAAPTATLSTGSLYSSDSGAIKELANSQGKAPDEIISDIGQQPGQVGPGPIGPGPGPTLSATFGGTIRESGAGQLLAGRFGFDASLSAGNGSISNGWISINEPGVYGSGLKAHQNAGSTVSGGNFTIPMQVTQKPTLPGDISLNNPANMQGSFSTSGDTVSGTWDVKPNSADHLYGAGPGSFEGSRQP